MKNIIILIVAFALICGVFVGLKNIVGEIDRIADEVATETSTGTSSGAASSESTSISSTYKCGICSAVLDDDFYCDACGQQWVPCAKCIGNVVYTPGDGCCVKCGDTTNLSKYGG